MHDFTLGQRWISDSEPELGLGLIMEIDTRMVTLEYPKVSETRMYAKATAPLTRISFIVGDDIQDRDQQIYTVTSVENVEGLLVYQATHKESPLTPPVAIIESSLNDHITLNQPLSRLTSGQTDHSRWFELRVKTLNVLNFIERSSLLGLCSARTELIPHQLFIANEVAQRHAPRVLLADEVGLGKTIEACLIMQQQLFSGQASRVLIIVPESLLHQWLVELLRRFNLAFSIFDHDRCQEIIEDGDNPFFSEQLILCTSELFINSSELLDLAAISDWDLLIVDEAHHLIPRPEINKESLQIESEEEEHQHAYIAYENIEKLSKKVKGLILLTATPDQLGQKSHFSLLRLLDPDRFYNFSNFIKEQNNFTKIASLIEQLENIEFTTNNDQIVNFTQQLTQLFRDKDIFNIINKLNDKTILPEEFELLREQLIDAILDRHGTGRVLFRNTRQIITGFPIRKLIGYPLTLPQLYQETKNSLNPEIEFMKSKQWLKEDPRVSFVEELLKKHHQQKILLIAANQSTVSSLEEHLRLHRGIKTSLFHENMSILERDRAAVYFADHEYGSQILLCSEIGSEGRNFQFSHHLVLFDLPLNPDLLEQRIGRLDRIGQKNTINIHSPYLQDSTQEKLFLWYSKGLNAFQKTNPAAYKVYQKLQQDLSLCFFDNKLKTNDLIKQTKKLNQQFLHDFSLGRDRLLEINSFNKTKSSVLIEKINLLESESNPYDYLNFAFDNFGLEVEENSDQSLTLNLSDQMVISSFSAIPEQGLTITYQRHIALHREDIQFVNWNHPIVEQTIDLVLQGDLGKSTIAILQDKRLTAGTILLESIYKVNVPAPKTLQLKRFLPTSTIRLLVDSDFRNLSPALSFEFLNENLQHVDRSQLTSHVSENKVKISQMSKLSEKQAMKQLPDIIQSSRTLMENSLSQESSRLKALQLVNPSIRNEEVNFLINQVKSLNHCFNDASLQLEAVRLIFIA